MKPTPLVVPAATPKPTVLAKGGASLAILVADGCSAVDVFTPVLTLGVAVLAWLTVTGTEGSGVAVAFDVAELDEAVDDGTAVVPVVGVAGRGGDACSPGAVLEDDPAAPADGCASVAFEDPGLAAVADVEVVVEVGVVVGALAGGAVGALETVTGAALGESADAVTEVLDKKSAKGASQAVNMQ